MPAACSALQLNPETDWMYTADAGNAGLGLAEGRMMVPRGKMLGGSVPGSTTWRTSAAIRATSTRGPPTGRRGGATTSVLPYFKKSEGLAPSGDIVVDADAHNTKGPLGVSVRAPVLRAAQEFVDAAVAAGIPVGDYNGRDRGGPDGVVSLLQTTTRDGKRSSTYHAFLEGDVEQRPNLEIITGAHVTRVLARRWSGRTDRARRRVPHRRRRDRPSPSPTRRSCSAPARSGHRRSCCSPASDRGPSSTRSGVPCQLDSPDVGKHLQGPSAGRAVLPGAGGGHLDDRGRSRRWGPTRSGRRRDRCRPIPRTTPTCPPSSRRSRRRPSDA